MCNYKFYPQNEAEENENVVEKSNDEEKFEINILNEVEYNVNAGEVILFDLNLITPESYIYEGTPFVLYSDYFDEEQWE